MQRLTQGTLPANQRVHMGSSLVRPAQVISPASGAAQAVPGGQASPEQREAIRKLEAEVADLTAKLTKANGVLQHLGPPSASPEALLQSLKDQAKSAEDLQAKLLQQTSLSETLAKKVKDLEELLAEAPKLLDTPKPLDRVWVTSVQSRSVDSGNVVVTCTMHQGQEENKVEGTILIPQAEFGKLRPPKQQ
jgi:small-conductance mechanosensitive channel